MLLLILFAHPLNNGLLLAWLLATGFPLRNAFETKTAVGVPRLQVCLVAVLMNFGSRLLAVDLVNVTDPMARHTLSTMVLHRSRWKVMDIPLCAIHLRLISKTLGWMRNVKRVNLRRLF